MPQRRPGEKRTLAAAALVAFVLLSGALSQIALAPGLRIESRMAETIDDAFTVQERTPNPLGGEAIGLIVSVVSGLSIILFIVSLLRREYRLSTIMAVLVGAALALLLSGIVRNPAESAGPVTEDGTPQSQGTGIGATQTLNEEDALSEETEDRPVSWFWSLFVLGPAAVGMFFVLRPRFGPVEVVSTRGAREIAREAADAIADGEELTGVIQRCYRDMVRSFEESISVKRGSSMTPRELEGRLLAEGVAGDDVRALTRLFENVRYGGGVTREADEASALLHFQRIAEALDRSDDG